MAAPAGVDASAGRRIWSGNGGYVHRDRRRRSDAGSHRDELSRLIERASTRERRLRLVLLQLLERRDDPAHGVAGGARGGGLRPSWRRELRALLHRQRLELEGPPDPLHFERVLVLTLHATQLDLQVVAARPRLGDFRFELLTPLLEGQCALLGGIACAVARGHAHEHRADLVRIRRPLGPEARDIQLQADDGDGLTLDDVGSQRPRGAADRPSGLLTRPGLLTRTGRYALEAVVARRRPLALSRSSHGP